MTHSIVASTDYCKKPAKIKIIINIRKTAKDFSRLLNTPKDPMKPNQTPPKKIPINPASSNRPNKSQHIIRNFNTSQKTPKKINRYQKTPTNYILRDFITSEQIPQIKTNSKQTPTNLKGPQTHLTLAHIKISHNRCRSNATDPTTIQQNTPLLPLPHQKKKEKEKKIMLTPQQSLTDPRLTRGTLRRP